MLCKKCGEPFDGSPSDSTCTRCESCSAQTGIVTGLLELASRVGRSVRPRLQEAPPDRRDFFISFQSNYRTEAERIDEVVQSQGKTTYFFPESGGSGNFWAEIEEAIEFSSHVICVISDDYFKSPYCMKEFHAFWNRSDDGRQILLFRVADCEIPMLYGPLRYNDLKDLEPEEYDSRVITALESSEKSYIGRFHADDTPREPPPERRSRPALPSGTADSAATRMLLVAVLLAVVPVYFASYFAVGAGGAWDPREAVAYAVTGKDISLPWRWFWRLSDLSEYVDAVTPETAARWAPLTGGPSTWKAADQSIAVIGAALLKSTNPGGGIVEDGIAQFRTIFTDGSIRLLADIRDNGQSYRGFQITQDASGTLVSSFFEKSAGGREIKRGPYAQVPIRSATAMHDFAISKDGELFSLYRNRTIVANWKPEYGRPLEWRGGAFGLAAEGPATVRLVRWSLKADRQSVAAARRLHVFPALLAGHFGGRSEWWPQ